MAAILSRPQCVDVACYLTAIVVTRAHETKQNGLYTNGKAKWRAVVWVITVAVLVHKHNKTTRHIV